MAKIARRFNAGAGRMNTGVPKGRRNRMASANGSTVASGLTSRAIWFPALKRRALGFLARRFSGKRWATGEVMVPDEALGPLAAEGIRFTVEGRRRFRK